MLNANPGYWIVGKIAPHSLKMTFLGPTAMEKSATMPPMKLNS